MRRADRRQAGSGAAAIFGLAEHRGHQPVEQVNGPIGQGRRNVQGGGDQRCVPAPSLVAGNMLDRGAASLARKLRQVRLVNEMPSARRPVSASRRLR